MANPNIVGLTSILGQTNGAQVGTTAVQPIGNGAGSGQVYKVNNIVLCNTSDENREVTVRFHIGASIYYITSALVVPGRSTIEVISKPLYLNEDSSIQALANTGTDVTILVSFEKIG